jgi:rhodanese-related sulfurtransferase
MLLKIFFGGSANMKAITKILSLLLVLFMLFGAVACSGGAVEEEPSMDLGDSEDPVVEPVDLGIVGEEVDAYFANMPDHIYKIGQQDFIDMVAAGDDMTILDIRQADAYAEGHVMGAINAPWGSAISDVLSKLPADKPLLVYCYSGQTAGQAVHTLNIAGFDARSVNLGYVFGISKVEGYEAYTDTVAVEVTEDVTEIDADIQTALDAYYAGLADVAGTQYANYKISEDNLQAMINGGEDFYLLSIRQQDAYDASHIAGAELLPWGSDMAAGFADLPMDKPVVVYCYSGQTAGQTVAALRLLGYDAVSLNGGMGVGANAPHGWSNHGKPTTSLDAAIVSYFESMPDHIYKIGQQDFIDMVAAGDDMTILDIRKADAYAEGHVMGAINAPWGGTAISDVLSKLPADKPLFVYCYSGQTAGQAVHTLNLAGFDARSVNLGYVFGISKVDGYEAYTDTVAVELTEDVTEINREVQIALDFYYAGMADVAGSQFANYKISEDNLEAMINGDEDFYLLSIRQQDAYDEGHIEGAELLPWGSDMAAGFGDLPMDKPVVVYCYSGQTAGQAVAALRLMGYDAVSLNGGMGVGANAPHGWSNHDKPVVQ